jgi:hypothetical protein
MSKYSEKNRVSDTTKAEAIKIARGTQKPGQTKEQTKLIAQGIQKGIEEYKKRQNAKARELDKKLKKAAVSNPADTSAAGYAAEPQAVKTNRLPWVLLILSWLGFAAYQLIIHLSS